MKKKIWIPIVCVAVLAAVSVAVHFIPIKGDSLDDEGRSDEQLHSYYQNVENSFVGTVTEISGNNVIVEPLEGEWERSTSDKFSISLEGMGINAKIGSKLKVYYKGEVMCIYPAIVNVIRCELVE